MPTVQSPHTITPIQSDTISSSLPSSQEQSPMLTQTAMPRHQRQQPFAHIRQGRKRITCFAKVMYWLGFLLFLIFTFVYVGLLQLFVLGGKVFQSNTANVGYYIHAITGVIYFAIGFAQFSSTIRTRFPTLHRRLGWAYFGLTLITTVGIVIILIGGSHAKESSVIATITGVPLWVALQVSAIRAIRCGNVDLHRRQQLRAFIMSFSIIFMRPGIMFLNVFVNLPREHMTELLKTVLWWVFVWAVIFTEAYLVRHRTVLKVPSSVVMLPVSSGRGHDDDQQQQVAVSTAHHLVPESGSIVSDLSHGSKWHPVRLEQSEYVNPTTVRLVFSATSPSRSFPWLVVPGQHIALSCTSSNTTIVRSYSPTTSPTAAAHRQIELYVRLVRGGAMSTLMERVAHPDPALPTADMRWHVAFSHTSLPYVPKLHTHLVLVAAGTGITPLWNLACTALACGARVHLMHVHASESAAFFEARLGDLSRGEQSGGRFSYEKVLTESAELGKSMNLRSEEGMVELVKRGVAAALQQATSPGESKGEAAIDGVIVFGCGPPSFGRHMVRACGSARGKKELGLESDQVFVVGVSDR